MSKLSGFLVRRAKSYAHYHREEIKARDDERFYSDFGALPMQQEHAYMIGSEGPVWHYPAWSGRPTFSQRTLVGPALPTDCIRPYDAGLELFNIGYDSADPFEDDWAERQWELDHDDPMVYAQSAHHAHEWGQWFKTEEQIKRLWEEHEGHADAPIFVRLVERHPASFATW
jgi:hypothetical protein